MAIRKGLGKGIGKGYRNIIGKDPRVHSDSSKGRKQPQRLKGIVRFPLQQQKIVEHGFDLTNFSSPDNFKRVLKENKLSLEATEIHRCIGDYYIVFEWKGKDVTLHTGNNPLTGKYSSPKQRDPEKGYASYMGIEGTPEAVEKLVKSIKKNATFIKGEDKTSKGYIW